LSLKDESAKWNATKKILLMRNELKPISMPYLTGQINIREEDSIKSSIS
jgi:hypothetical protein